MLISSSTFPIIAPLVNNPPSRNAWNPTMLSEIGRSRRATEAILFFIIRTRHRAKTTVIIHITYPECIRIIMKSNAIDDVYMSAVGAGNMPSVPRIGMMSISDNITFKIMFVIFFIW